MASTEQDSGVVLTWESAASVASGSLAVAGSRRSEGGFTVYRIVFKVGTGLAVLACAVRVCECSLCVRLCRCGRRTLKATQSTWR